MREEFKRFAQEKSLEALKAVWGVLENEMTNQRDKLAAARLLMEYGYGRPAAELDRERLDIDRKRLEMEQKRVERDDAQTATVVVEWDGAEEFAG